MNQFTGMPFSFYQYAEKILKMGLQLAGLVCILHVLYNRLDT